ncbi:MAG: T9SS type A sorting domain-containing protein, partial [Bacteroidales bacterium]|nr:T9SS type A sorting domain-containing protein [Bacteroidales bacterium]
EDVTVYPNPATTSCIIECPAQMGKLVVVNEKGMIVRSVEDVNATSYELDMDGLAKGTYFIQIIAPQGNIVKKVVKM